MMWYPLTSDPQDTEQASALLDCSVQMLDGLSATQTSVGFWGQKVIDHPNSSSSLAAGSELCSATTRWRAANKKWPR